MAKNRDYVSVSRDEYDELIECKTKINLLIDYAIAREKTAILEAGIPASIYNANSVNNILGSSYIDSYIDEFEREYKERIGKKK